MTVCFHLTKCVWYDAGGEIYLKLNNICAMGVVELCVENTDFENVPTSAEYGVRVVTGVRATGHL